MRDNHELKEKLDRIWSTHFPDVPKFNNVQIRFGRKAVKRLGSIRELAEKSTLPNNFDTLILINGHFKDKNVPEFIIDATIAHELCHYVHGFASPLPQLSPYPHKGGQVDREMQKRGLDELLCREQNWLNSNWMNYLKNICK